MRRRPLRDRPHDLTSFAAFGDWNGVPRTASGDELASRITSGELLHYTTYGEQFAIQEMAVPESWAGKTLAELKLPEHHQIHVVAVHDILAAPNL